MGNVSATFVTNNEPAKARARQANAFLTRATDVLQSSTPASKKLQMLKAMVPPGVVAGQLQQLLGLSPGQLSAVQSRSQELLAQAAASRFDQNQETATELGLLGALPAGVDSRVRTAISAILGMFMAPTQIVDWAATKQKRATAAKAVPDVVNTIYADQVIVRRGDLITPSIADQLKALGLQTKQTGWQDVFGGALFAVLIVTMLFWYLYAFEPGILANDRILLLVDACIVLAVLGARLLSANHVLLPYFLPVAAATTFAAALISPEACVALALAVALLAGWVVNSSFEIVIYYFVTAAAGALAVRKIRELRQFIFAGLYIAATALLTELAFGLLDRVYDFNALQDYVAAAATNGFVSSAFALGAFAVLSGFFGVTTTIQLLELGQPSHPLLRRLMVSAPGTYNHSLILATMVERAAEEIGADSLAAKLGALYHDAGKTINPHAFVENQLGMSNIHDDLRPEESARVIRGHVQQGLRLARHNRLPRLVLDAISEHHGTMQISFFLQKAREEGFEPVDTSIFIYPGPKPQSKETALLMLADGCEAAARASNDHSPAKVREIVERIIAERIDQGQLDESPLTLRDLDRAKEAFCSVLNSLYHPRIEYPDPIEAEIVEEVVPVPDPSELPRGRSLASEI
jgi:putative nucleotidyltransferase with HDIG domain